MEPASKVAGPIGKTADCCYLRRTGPARFFWRFKQIRALGGYMGIIAWLVVGLIAGFIGSKIVNRTGEGLVRDVLLGVVGAIVGGEIFERLGYAGVTGINLGSIVIAVIGSIIVLVVYHLVTGQRTV